MPHKTSIEKATVYRLHQLYGFRPIVKQISSRENYYLFFWLCNWLNQVAQRRVMSMRICQKILPENCVRSIVWTCTPAINSSTYVYIDDTVFRAMIFLHKGVILDSKPKDLCYLLVKAPVLALKQFILRMQSNFLIIIGSFINMFTSWIQDI